jgi:hypothetical protein
MFFLIIISESKRKSKKSLHGTCRGENRENKKAAGWLTGSLCGIRGAYTAYL